MVDSLDVLIPEWAPFRDALTAHRPDQGTACTAWTVHDIAAHNAGNAEELARILGAYLDGTPVPPTRSFEEREPRFRALPDGELLEVLDAQVAHLGELLDTAQGVDPEQPVPWTGRTMQVREFGEHMREELILHRWDMTGDDDVSRRQLSQSWLTTHSVRAVGKPLLRKGIANLGEDSRVKARLRVDGLDDVLLEAGPDTTSISVAPPAGPAVVETDAAARVLLLWGRQPADPGRLYSSAGPDLLGRARTLLSGY